MDIENTDVNERAGAYEDTLRLYFSRPEIHGILLPILLWGFWNEEHSKPDAALFEGPDLTVSWFIEGLKTEFQWFTVLYGIECSFWWQ